jgi:hypothetical protein
MYPQGTIIIKKEVMYLKYLRKEMLSQEFHIQQRQLLSVKGISWVSLMAQWSALVQHAQAWGIIPSTAKRKRNKTRQTTAPPEEHV